MFSSEFSKTRRSEEDVKWSNFEMNVTCVFGGDALKREVKMFNIKHRVGKATLVCLFLEYFLLPFLSFSINVLADVLTELYENTEIDGNWQNWNHRLLHGN